MSTAAIAAESLAVKEISTLSRKVQLVAERSGPVRFKRGTLYFCVEDSE